MDQNKKQKKGGRGLSGGTVVLICAALAITLLAVFFIVKALTPKEPAQTQPQTPSTIETKDLSPTSAGKTSLVPPESETAKTPETAVTSPVPSEPIEPSPTTGESGGSASGTTETPQTETPQTETAPPDPDTKEIYMQVPGEEDMRRYVVDIDGVSLSIGYFLPKIVVGGSEAAEKAVNATVHKAVQRTVDRLSENLHNNFDPVVMTPEDREIGIFFHKSAHTFSVILRYELIAGSGEAVAEAYSVNFDAAGAQISVDDILIDRAAAADYVKLNADAGDEPDFSMLEGGRPFCSAWYIDGEELTLLYNGKTLDLLYPFVLFVTMNAPGVYET